MHRLIANIVAQIMLLLAFSLSTLCAQELSYRQFTIEDGLPSNQVYEICQDKNRYIWFGTENGLSRFDGANFKNFTIHDGLPDTEILGMYEDSKNRIWLKTLNGKIGFIRDGKFYNGQNTPFLKGQSLENVITEIVEDKKGNLYFLSKYYYLHLKPNDIFTKKSLPDRIPLQAKAKNGDVYLFSPISLLDSIIYLAPDLVETKYQDHLFVPTQQLQFIQRYNNWMTIKKILQIEPSEQNAIVENVSSEFIEYNGDKWIYGITTPLQKLSYKGDRLNVESWGDDLLMSYAMVDQTNNLWFGSPDKGAFLIRAFNSYNYKVGKHLKGGNLNSFHLDKKNKKLYTGSVDACINVISEQGVRSKKYSRVESNSPKIRSLKTDKQENLWVVYDLKIDKLNGETLKPVSDFIFQLHGSPKFISLQKDSLIGYLASSRNTHSFSYEKNNVISDNLNIYNSRSTCLYFEEQNERLWIGTPSGLLYSDKGSTVNPKSKLLSDDPISFINKVDSTLIVGTNGKGIVLLKNNQIRRLTMEDGLASNLIRSIYIHKDKSIWIATNQGLSVLKSTHPDSLQFFTLNKDNGLISNEVLDCDILDSTLYVLSTQGVTILNLADIDDQQAHPIINIEKILVNNVAINKDSLTLLNHQQNNLRILFNCVHFGNRSELEYSYKLKGYHQDWQRTNNTDLLFEKLQPGKYQLELQAVIKDNKSLNSNIIEFEIIPAFYQRTWVQVLAALLLILAIAFFIRALFEREKKKNKIKNRLLQLEHIALQSQMSPHFIKNALGAIQHLMIKKDVRTANKYLITFGELITQFLKQADQSTIKVKDEIDVLNLYLSIEKLRFENNFQYTIDCQTDDLLESEFPSMMIQPLVENSILHGFRDLGRDKINQVNISLKAHGDDYIICTIADNGLGMDKKKEQKYRVKKSGIALKNIKERISLLSLQYPQTSFKILQTDSSGTSIELCLPVRIR